MVGGRGNGATCRPYPRTVQQGDDEWEDDAFGGFSAPLPPDDRLWRHPSELEFGDEHRRRRRSRGTWPAALVAGLLGSVLTLGIVSVSGLLDPEEPVEPRVVTERVRPVSAPRTSPGSDVVRIAAETSGAIPRIEVDGAAPGSGSGVVIRDDGYLLTNAHVVRGADRITVVMADGSELDGALVGQDEVTDIAVVKVESPEPFATAVLGSAAHLQVGEPVIAIGSPLGLAGGSSVTTGVVSALGRQVQGQDGESLLDMIQTDAAISPGSSGGALLDATGAVIGITTAIAVSDVGPEGLGFATPVDIAKSVAEEIIRTGRALHVWLGVEGGDLDRPSALREGVPGGALVRRVIPDSPANRGGLEDRDVILAVGNEPIASMSALVIALRDLEPGDVVDLVYLRGGERHTVSVTLVERPSILD